MTLKNTACSPHLNAIFVHHHHTPFVNLIVLLYVYHLSKSKYSYIRHVSMAGLQSFLRLPF